ASGLSYVEFTAALGPIALLGLGIIWVVLVLVYPREFTAAPLAVMPPALPSPNFRRLRKSLLATGLMLVALIAGAPVPLAAALAAALLLISRRQDPDRVFQEIDWSLLVFFCGLFVVTGAIGHSGLGPRLFGVLQPLADH